MEELTEPANAAHRRHLRWYIGVAAAVAAVVATVGGILLFGGSSSPTPAGSPLSLSLGGGDSLASCIRFDTTILAGMPVAFEGTAVSVNGDEVTLEVDHWYRGGDAKTVQLQAPLGMRGLTAGIDFVQGEQYLVTATDGVVNYCGFSGPSTADYRAAFEEAFKS